MRNQIELEEKFIGSSKSKFQPQQKNKQSKIHAMSAFNFWIYTSYNHITYSVQFKLNVMSMYMLIE